MSLTTLVIHLLGKIIPPRQHSEISPLLIAEQLGAPVFFAHPYRSCERGLNENTNGLIRQYIPKAQNFKELTQHHFDTVQDKLNNRPRKSLGFLSPIEFLYKSSQPPPAVAFEP